MGRLKKVVEIDREVVEKLSTKEKLELLEAASQVFNYTLEQIPVVEVEAVLNRKAEIQAKVYCEQKGFEVYTSKTNGGYRSIGTEFYWQEFKECISDNDKLMIDKLKQILSPEDFKDLAFAVRDKNGTPDFLLIKNGKLMFAEVKYGYETVKTSTIKFFLLYGDKWSVIILRVVKPKKEETR